MKKLLIFSVFQMWVVMLFSQDVTLTTQAEVNAFNSTNVDYLIISGSDITEVSLNNLRRIRKGLLITECPDLETIHGFNNLESVGENKDFWSFWNYDDPVFMFEISHNPKLKEIIGFEQLRRIAKDEDLDTHNAQNKVIPIVDIFNNDQLEIISGFDSLEHTYGINVSSNPDLTSVNFKSEDIYLEHYRWANGTWIGWDIVVCTLDISDNQKLESCKVNVSATSNKMTVSIRNNPRLSTLQFVSLENMARLYISNNSKVIDLPTITGSTNHTDVWIWNNDKLASIESLNDATRIGGSLADYVFTIGLNPTLSSIELPNLVNGSLEILSNQNCKKISLPKFQFYSSGYDPSWPSTYRANSIDSNPNLESIEIGLTCSDDDLISLDGYNEIGRTKITNNTKLNSLLIYPDRKNIRGITISGNPELNKVHGFNNAENVVEIIIENNGQSMDCIFPDELETFCNNCNIESCENIYEQEGSVVFSTGMSSCYSFDCEEEIPATIDEIIDSIGIYQDCNYLGNAVYEDIEVQEGLNVLYYTVPNSGLIDSVIFTIETQSLILINRAEDIMVTDNDEMYKEKIDQWIMQNGGASAYSCANIQWEQNYDDDYSLGDHWVTFTAKDDTGLTVETTALLSIQTCAGTIIRQADELVIQCDAVGDYIEEVDNWIADNGGLMFEADCDEVIYSNDWNNSYNLGDYVVTFTVTGATSNFSYSYEAILSIQQGGDAPVMTDEAADFTIPIYDPTLEESIQLWIDSNGGAIAVDNCGAIEWSHNYDFDYSVGNYLVTFTATADNGQSVETTALLAIQACLGQWTSQAQELTVPCDQQGNYINQVDDWLSSNGGLTLTSNCDDVEWTNDWEGSYDFGNYWVTFTASGATSAFEYSRGAFLSIQRGEASPMVTMEASDIKILNTDPTLESSIQSWISTQGGASAIDNCGTFTWSNNYSGQTEPGEYSITFTATSDNGAAMETTATLTIELMSSVGEESTRKLEVGPNPASTFIQINGIESGIQYQVYGIDGKLYQEGITEHTETVVDISALDDGVVVIVLVRPSGGVESYKIIKQ